MSDFRHLGVVLKLCKTGACSLVYVIKFFFNLNSQGNEKLELFSQLTYDFQNYRNETLFIADYKMLRNPHLIG